MRTLKDELTAQNEFVTASIARWSLEPSPHAASRGKALISSTSPNSLTRGPCGVTFDLGRIILDFINNKDIVFGPQE